MIVLTLLMAVLLLNHTTQSIRKTLLEVAHLGCAVDYSTKAGDQSFAYPIKS